MKENTIPATEETTRPSVKDMMKALAPVVITSALTSAACFVIANRIKNAETTES